MISVATSYLQSPKPKHGRINSTLGFVVGQSNCFTSSLFINLCPKVPHYIHSTSPPLQPSLPTDSLPTTTLTCQLQDLELPGVLVFVVKTVSGVEIELPGRLVLVVQTVDGSEAQRGGRVALRGQRGRRLAERPAHGGSRDGAERTSGA